MIVDNYIIYKKNLNRDYTVNINSICKENLLYLKAESHEIPKGKNTSTLLSNSSNVVSKNVYRPAGKYSAVVKGSVTTMRFGQTSKSTFLTNNRTARFVSKNVKDITGVVIEQLAASILGGIASRYLPIVSPILTTSFLLKDLYTASIVAEVAKLHLAGKGAELCVVSSNYGGGAAVKEWNQRYIHYIKGTKIEQSGSLILKTSYNTDIYWSSAK